MARRHVGVVSLRVGFLIRVQSLISPSVLWTRERWGPSITTVDLTVTDVVSNVYRHTGMTRREKAARPRASCDSGS